MQSSNQPAVPDSAVRQQLEKILAHRLFSRSGRMARFLRLTVERTLAGQADELKEYLIGVEVFDRKSSYDPRVDPIVRVEARRLRSKLKAYYEGDGSGDPVLIEFLSGQLRAAPGAARSAAAPAARSRRGVITVAVLPFADLGLKPENQYFSDGLTEELIHALTKVPRLRVVAWNTAAQLRDRQEDVRAIARPAQGGYGAHRQRAHRRRQPARARAVDRYRVRRLPLVGDLRPPHAGRLRDSGRDRAGDRPHPARATHRRGEGALLARGRSTISSYDYYLQGPLLLASPHAGRPAAQHRVFRGRDRRRPQLRAGARRPGRRLHAAGGLRPASPAEGMPKAKAAAERAIELDPALAEAYASLALIRSLYDWEWQDARAPLSSAPSS